MMLVFMILRRKYLNERNSVTNLNEKISASLAL
jgi:hypothetical protein